MAGSSENTGTSPIRPPRVVVLGGGYGGVYAALKLQKAAKRGGIELSLISRDNYFLSQPMLAEVVSGSIEPPHIVNPTRRLLPQASFHQAEIESVETDTRNVVINYHGDHTHFDRIPYDHLIIAVGSGTDLSNLPGMAEHAFPFNRASPDQTNFPGNSSFWDTVKYNPAFQGRQMRPDSLKFPVFI